MRLTLALLALQSVALTWTPSPTPNATTSVVRDGVTIASGLTVAGFTDAAVAAGTHAYWVTATAPGLATSAPSNTFTAVIPALIPTMIGYGTSVLNGNLTRVTINVTAVSGKDIPQGTVTWAINGKPIYVDTLLKNGKDGKDVWTILLTSSIPVTITYSGNANFGVSSTTLP
jgi:hypothetical protein